MSALFVVLSDFIGSGPWFNEIGFTFYETGVLTEEFTVVYALKLWEG